MNVVPNVGSNKTKDDGNIPSGSDHNGSGFCWNKRCPDKEDRHLINALARAVRSGLCTPQEADLIYHGRTV